MTKLKIDLQNGLLEVEGEESFVKEIYQDFKDRIRTQETPPSPDKKDTREFHHDEPNKNASVKKNNGAKSGSKRKESYQIVKDIDLSAKSGKEALKKFYEKKSPSTAMQKNAVFVYYLERVAGVQSIGVNHIYTCYKDVNEKVPGALRQSLLDTSFKKGWIDTKSMENITVTTHGENLVEHSLPEQKSEK